MIVVHLLIWVASFGGAFLLRFDFIVPEPYRALSYWCWLAPLLLLRTVFYAHYGLFTGMWRYSGQRDLEGLVKATGVSTAAFALLVLFAGLRSFPRSVFLVEFLLAVAASGGLRFMSRALANAAQSSSHPATRRLLIVGAGDAGEALMREIDRNIATVTAVGFLDDNAGKQGMRIHNVKVLGHLEDAPQVIADHRVTEVVVAIPTATGRDMRRIVDLCTVEGVPVRTVPGMDHLIDGKVTINQIREVAIEDLLGRAPVTLDADLISEMIRHEVVLVTGAGGSIGSELCRQVARYKPRTLVLLEQAENSLYQVHRELKGGFPEVELAPRIADICDPARLAEVFAETRPGLVLHAAAHKHVPMMEWNPGEAIKNNVGGTRNVANAAHAVRARRFVMISTDKAVNPTSVMGCTKRIAELYVQAQAQRSETVFATVRFGNVLGSNGSVIPLFREQIAKGGPVTVTHPDMRRYFMTIPEASQLVLQAGVMGSSGDIYILDMGEPVRITGLAEDLIRLSGLKVGRDIEIVYSGVRPGEKLFEELSVRSENATKTKHPKIFIGSGEPRDRGRLDAAIERLLSSSSESPEEVRRALKQVVPTYHLPSEGAQVIPLKSKTGGP